MMYIRWFVEFVFDMITAPFEIGAALLDLIVDLISGLIRLIDVLPVWIEVPFYLLLAMAVLFRISQFIPGIGGASD